MKNLKKRILSKYVILAALLIMALQTSACGAKADDTQSTLEEVDETTKNSSKLGEAVTEKETQEDTEETIEQATEVASEDAASQTEEPESSGYTYTDLTATMYATYAVNVRDNPSTDGTKLGSLSYNQQVSVTGRCNETGWYRIDYNGGAAYVSDSYLSETNQASQTYSKGSVNADNKASSGSSSTNQTEGYFDRAMAEAVFNSINAERAAAGENQLTWNEEAYNFACTRAQEIMTDFSHNGCSAAWGENIARSSSASASYIHNQYYNSQGHHENYMSTMYSAGAVAVWIQNGYAYSAEEFIPSSTNSGRDMTIVDTWTASNGVTVIKRASGQIEASGPTGTGQDALLAAIDEYNACH